MFNVHERAVFYEVLDEIMTTIEEKGEVLSDLKEHYQQVANDLMTETDRIADYKDALHNVVYYGERKRACMEIYDRLQNIFGG